MKKIILSVLIGMSSFILRAQNSSIVTSANVDSVTDNKQSKSVEERLKLQEQEVRSLKKDNEDLRQQLKQLRSALHNKHRKVSVSRMGSKQVNIE